MTVKRHHAVHPPSLVKANPNGNAKPNPRAVPPQCMMRDTDEGCDPDVDVCDDDMDLDTRKLRVPHIS